MVRSVAIGCVLLLMLSVEGCGGEGPVANGASKTAGLPDVIVSAPSASGEPHVITQPANTLQATTSKTKIPVAVQGRWGLTPSDCTSEPANAKGLLIVGSDELRFYESHAVPAENVAADQNSISGNFAFRGEGQRWTKYEALKVDKHSLIRTEMNPTASFTYAKCS